MSSVFFKAVALFLIATLYTGCQDRAPSSELAHEQSELSQHQFAQYIRIAKHFVTKDFVLRTGFNRDHKVDEVYAFGYLTNHAINHLTIDERKNINVLPMALSQVNFDAHSLQPFENIDLLQSKAREDGYHNYIKLTSKLKSLANQFPSISKLTSIGQSVRGRELWMMKISDNAHIDEDEPKLLYIANMHGDEVVGREMMIYLIEKLLNEFENSPRIQELVNYSQIFIIPSMNPDGFESGSRFNGNGKDLNRDFPDFTTDPEDTLAGRQPETQAIMRLHSEHHFLMALNFHGGAICFNLPWDTAPNSHMHDKFEDDPLLWQLGRDYADTNASMYNGGFDDGLTYGYEWYEVNGGMQDWANFYRRSIHATVELSRSKWPSGSSLPRFWQDNEEALISYLEKGLRGVHLKVVGESGSLLMNVQISTSTSNRQLIYHQGLIHRPTLPDAAQKATIEAEGFEAVTIDFDPHHFEGNWREIMLRRAD